MNPHSDSKFIAAVKLRLHTLLFPPLGLVYRWRTPRCVARKIFGTIGIALFSVVYLATHDFIAADCTWPKLTGRAAPGHGPFAASTSCRLIHTEAG